MPTTVAVMANAGGQQQNLSDTVRGLGTALLLSFLLVYLLMVALYDSYRLPFIIMFAVPVAAVGAFVARDHASGAQPLLADRHGPARRPRLEERHPAGRLSPTTWSSGHGPQPRDDEAARERFRPIVMTTCAMIAGMTPIALALDPGAAQRQALGHRRHRRSDQLAAADARARAGHVHVAGAKAARHDRRRASAAMRHSPAASV